MMGEVEYEIDFLFDILLTQRCCFGFHKIERQIWREDIVTPYVVTYAVPLRPAFATSYILITLSRKGPQILSKNLRGYFDEMRRKQKKNR